MHLNEIFNFSCCNCFCTLHQKSHTSISWEISNQNYCYEVQHQNENHILVLLDTLQRYADIKSERFVFVYVLGFWFFCLFFSKKPTTCLLSEVDIRRLFFPSPVVCFCTKHKTDLILPYGDNQAALNTREKETIFICHARWDVQLLDTWSCSPHRRTQSRAEMPSQWTI